MKSIIAWTVLAILPLYVAAHNKPTTPEEIEVHRSLQAAAYYVRPDINPFMIYNGVEPDFSLSE